MRLRSWLVGAPSYGASRLLHELCYWRLASAESVVLRSFFFEEKAFNDDQELRQDKVLSINKVGHGERLLYLRCSPTCSLWCSACGSLRPHHDL